MKGIQSIKVHRGFELASSNHIIRWTEVFIIQVAAINVICLFPKLLLILTTLS